MLHIAIYTTKLSERYACFMLANTIITRAVECCVLPYTTRLNKGPMQLYVLPDTTRLHKGFYAVMCVAI